MSESRLRVTPRALLAAGRENNLVAKTPRRGAVGASARFPIVVHSHLRWSFVWQRPQQVHSRLARSHRILFLEEPLRAGDGERSRLQLHRAAPNLYVAQPLLAAEAWETREALEQATLAVLRESLDGLLGRVFAGAAHWLYSPLLEFQIDAFRSPGTVVYDCMDELSNFAFAPPELGEREARLLERADLVLAGGHELYLAKKDRHPNVHVFGCGVEFEHFSRARNGARPAPDLESIPAPRVGYVGVVDERLDYELIEGMARENPGWSVVLIGPIVKVDPETLPKLPNVHYLGSRRYEDLPEYLAAFDVCMMPFAMNDASRYINPTKTLEYLATGKPVVSTPIRDVVRRFSEVVFVAERKEFARRVADALAGKRLDPERGLEMARLSSWEETVAEMEKLVLEAAARTAGANAAIRSLGNERRGGALLPPPPAKWRASRPSEA